MSKGGREDACVQLLERGTAGEGGTTYSNCNTKTRNAGLADDSCRGTNYDVQRFPKSKTKSEKNEVASFPGRGRLTPRNDEE